MLILNDEAHHCYLPKAKGRDTEEEASATENERAAVWFTGLTERRLWLNEGREFSLAGRAVTAHRVNTMIIGYAEIDGVEARVLPDGDKKAQLARTVRYTEIKPGAEPVKVTAAAP